jgi:hypothetical protein
MRPSALLRRLWCAQLRLRVMAGVVIVMLLAIAAFDIGAVATMRRYLLGQTDRNLQVTLAMTRIQLPSLLPGYPFAAVVHPNVAQAPAGGGANVTWTRASSSPVRSPLGEFSITATLTRSCGTTRRSPSAWSGSTLPSSPRAGKR